MSLLSCLWTLSIVAIALLALPTSSQAAPATLRATNLRCEYKTNPLGIEIAAPRLSWLLASDKSEERGQAQSAYQILVASNRAGLDHDNGDLWNPGKVASDESIQIEYAGKKLASSQQAWWKVRVWNKSGQPSSWSEPATWTMGSARQEGLEGEVDRLRRAGRR